MFPAQIGPNPVRAAVVGAIVNPDYFRYSILFVEQFLEFVVKNRKIITFIIDGNYD
jgi:hypothetical protein